MRSLDRMLPRPEKPRVTWNERGAGPGRYTAHVKRTHAISWEASKRKNTRGSSGNLYTPSLTFSRDKKCRVIYAPGLFRQPRINRRFCPAVPGPDRFHRARYQRQHFRAHRDLSSQRHAYATVYRNLYHADQTCRAPNKSAHWRRYRKIHSPRIG